MRNDVTDLAQDTKAGSVAELRDLDWPACLNARDLGGLPTAVAGRVREQALIRSDRLSRLTDDGVEAVRRLRPSRIIDLRTSTQCEREPSPFAAADMYCHMPLSMPLDPPNRQARLIDRYRSKLDLYPHRFAQAVAAVADAPPGPVVVHCQAGKDRTGLVIALVLKAVGVPDDAVAVDYAVSSARLGAYYTAKRADIEDPELLELVRELHSARADTMACTLTYLRDEFGGVEPYLRRGGLVERQLEALQERLVVRSPPSSTKAHV
ncbi:tyrosine-protein phosphatase [Amycolatopsis nalaikhensis]|uniref:Tyrosine-protein phosphatase n=1 Tax=Amycolatopsis nalaikhensis TaxID=715472 RepID=A0ABY8XQB4_9PSEU|nr:tyrosine-protein phosphatase [Amycolatopsis sp. 2-2]WIV57860.1 tyrosine-protein phosphatase [Amycolatopsis sp. 2-2]